MAVNFLQINVSLMQCIDVVIISNIWIGVFSILYFRMVYVMSYLVRLRNIGVNSTAQGFSVKDSIIDDSFFNISEMQLSISSLFSVQIMSYLGATDIIYSDVIDSFISDILNYNSQVIQSLTEKPQVVLFTPSKHRFNQF